MVECTVLSEEKWSTYLPYFASIDLDCLAVFISGWLINMGNHWSNPKWNGVSAHHLILKVIKTNKLEHSGLSCSVLWSYLLIVLIGQSNILFLLQSKVSQWWNCEFLKVWIINKGALGPSYDVWEERKGTRPHRVTNLIGKAMQIANPFGHCESW